jgi:hypothetical protein
MKLHSKGWTPLQSTGPTTGKVLKQAIPGNPNITSVEEIDAAMTTFTSTIKSAKNASKLYYTYPPRDTAIPDLADLLRRKRQPKEKHAQF